MCSEVELRAIFAAYGTITHVAVTAPCAVVCFEEHQDACAAIDDPQCVLVEAAIDKKWAMFPQPTPETPTESKSGYASGYPMVRTWGICGICVFVSTDLTCIMLTHTQRKHTEMTTRATKQRAFGRRE
jgi:hypothetical protein